MNILVLSSKYPDKKPVKGFTPVVHYFAKEWVAQGHKVSVIHSQSKFPSLLYKLPLALTKRVENKLGFTFPKASMNTEDSFMLDEVYVKRFMLFRIFPFINYLPNTLRKHIERIHEANLEDSFKPDLIVSHFFNPQVILATELKKKYNCKTSLVMHSVPKNITSFVKYFSDIDVFGFRSLRIKDSFCEKITVSKKFMCYSGIDENEIVKNSKEFNSRIKKFIFVGVLIKRKYPDELLNALSDLEYKDYECAIIGDGPERNNLENIIKEKGLSSNIKMLGHIDRKDVMKSLELHDCFIMISEKEVFGLVYIEAMAKGCIVIAAKNEGMQGVIDNGVNGFLCTAGNSYELLSVINRINNLSPEEKNEISEKAIITAKKYTEKNVATKYLEDVIKLSNE